MKWLHHSRKEKRKDERERGHPRKYSGGGKWARGTLRKGEYPENTGAGIREGYRRSI